MEESGGLLSIRSQSQTQLKLLSSSSSSSSSKKRKGFPGGASGKEPAYESKRRKRPGFDPWVGKTPAGGHGNSLQYSCLENPHGQRSLAGYSPWDCKELDMTEAPQHETRAGKWKSTSRSNPPLMTSFPDKPGQLVISTITSFYNSGN